MRFSSASPVLARLAESCRDDDRAVHSGLRALEQTSGTVARGCGDDREIDPPGDVADVG